ncbi:MAG: PAS domain S-box protein [Leptospira sp.]|nr:PAS domain S-box protein [Leptospira sp.]
MNRNDLDLLIQSLHPVNEGILIVDPLLFTIIHVNPKLETILGYQENELVGRDLDLILPIKDQINEFTHILKDNANFSKISWQILSKTFDLIDIDFTIQKIYLDKSSKYNEIFLIYVRDTTEKRNMERTITFTQNLLRAIREIKQAIYLNQEPYEVIQTTCISLQKARGFDLVWSVVFEDDGSEKIFLHSKDKKKEQNYNHKLKELYNSDPSSLPIHIVSNDPYSIMHFHSSEKDVSFKQYYNVFHPNQKIEALCFQVSWNNRIYGAIELIHFKDYQFAEDDIHILQELGNDLGFMIYSKKTEEIKIEAIQRIEYQGILLDTIDVPILSLDRSGRIQYANNAAENRLHYKLDEMQSMNALNILNLTQTTLDYIKTRTVQREIVIQNPKTPIFPAMLNSSPILGRNNEFLGIMVVIFDITERKEQEIRNRNLDRLLIESAKFASIGELAAGIAHEINNPLQSALLYLEDLIQVDEEDPTERKKILQIIESANLRIKTLVKNLLDLGRNPSTEKDWISPELLLERVLDLVEANSKKNKIKLEKHIVEGLPNIYVRWQEIEQVIINCIINSINAIAEMDQPPTEPLIKIFIEKMKQNGKDCIRFRIEDNGPGIDISMIEKIFLPLVTSRRSKHGTGLGLAISKKIVTSHGGTIEFDPNFDNGSRLEFILPMENSN